MSAASVDAAPKKLRSPELMQAPSRFAMYERSVQNAPHEVALLGRLFKAARGRRAQSLREDFAGTALVSAAWVASGADRSAEAVDHDASALRYATDEHLAKMPEGARIRFELRLDDVRSASETPVDIVCAENFSYGVFHTRDELRLYFEYARNNLVKDGLFLLDLQGGWLTQQEDREQVQRFEGFSSVWRCERFDPISHRVRYRLDFDVDGIGRVDGFVYDWRQWSIPEVRELLQEAGFSSSEVWWPHGVGHRRGVYRRRTEAPADELFVSYVAAWR